MNLLSRKTRSETEVLQAIYYKMNKNFNVTIITKLRQSIITSLN